MLARETALLGDAGSGPIEDRLHWTISLTIEALFEDELGAFLWQLRYRRGDGICKGYRHGRGARQIAGTFRMETVDVAPGYIKGIGGKSAGWRSQSLRLVSGARRSS